MLLPELVDHLAANEPDTLWGEYPRSSTSFDDGFNQLSYAQFANAVNGVAHHLENTLGRAQTGETLAYLAPNDPRCTISMVAAMKAGFKVRYIIQSPVDHLGTDRRLAVLVFRAQRRRG